LAWLEAAVRDCSSFGDIGFQGNRVTAAIQRSAQLQGPFSSHAPPRKPNKFSSLSSKAQPNNREEKRDPTFLFVHLL